MVYQKVCHFAFLVGGDGRDGKDIFFFFGGGGACNFFGCKFTVWYFVPFYFRIIQLVKKCNSPRPDLDVQAYIKNVAEHDIIW